MVYRPHTYVTLSGTNEETTAGDEIWQIGVRGLNPTSGADAPVDAGQLQALADAIWAPAAAWFSSATSGMTTVSTLTQVKAANIGPDGLYTSQPGIHVGSAAGAATSQGFPSFCSLAYTFRTGMPGKRAKNGRVYPPNFGYPLAVGSVVSTTTVTTALASAVTFLNAINQSGAQFLFRPAVVSALGPYAYINSVGVDKVIDVQRRRKNAVSSFGRTSQAYVPAH